NYPVAERPGNGERTAVNDRSGRRGSDRGHMANVAADLIENCLTRDDPRSKRVAARCLGGTHKIGERESVDPFVFRVLDRVVSRTITDVEAAARTFLSQ